MVVRMETLKVKWTGIRPLIMHNAAMIDPDNIWVREMDKLKKELKKAKKDDYDGREKIRRATERAEWMGSIYYSSELGVYIPGDCITATIVNGARKAKAGKLVEQGVVPIDDVPIQTKRKTQDLDALFKDPEFQLRKPVRIPPRTGARLMKVRPMIPTGWVLEFEIEYDATVIPTEDLKEANEVGGQLIGLCDWRPRFGRFLVEFV